MYYTCHMSHVTFVACLTRRRVTYLTFHSDESVLALTYSGSLVADLVARLTVFVAVDRRCKHHVTDVYYLMYYIIRDVIIVEGFAAFDVYNVLR